MAIQDGGITVLDLSGVVHNDNLSFKVLNFGSGVVFGVRAYITSFNIFNGDVFNVESDIVTGGSLGQRFVMHFDGFDFSGNINWGESDSHTGF